MKKYPIFLILFLSLLTISYGQRNTVVINTGYVVTDDSDAYDTLKSLSEFKKNVKYSRINQKIVVAEVFKKKDTEIWYYLLDEKNVAHYKIILDQKNREHFVKKYGKFYIRKRKTPKLY